MDPLGNKEDYYKDSSCASFSGLKVFSKCETLYRDIFVTKEYEEPDYDYFVYGKLVDAFLTEPEAFIEENFVKVERKVKAEDALRLENNITMLQMEIAQKREEGEKKLAGKRAEVQVKIDELETKIQEQNAAGEDPAKNLDKQAKLVEKRDAIEPDKTLAKGIVSREEQIKEIQSQLDVIKALGTKQQVTPSIWDNAVETADAIKSHPSFQTMEFNGATSQQVFRCTIDGVPFKGKLDHLKLSPELTTLYSVYAADQMTLEELQEKIRTTIHPTDLWAIITDIKTCRDLKSLEPYNPHYRGQLGTYRELVSRTLLIPKNNIRCRILVADKLNNAFKKVELFEYTIESLDDLHADVVAWGKLWYAATQNGVYISDKAKRGLSQECFTCTECRFCPFALIPGTPVVVSQPRFGLGLPANLSEELSTADAALE